MPESWGSNQVVSLKAMERVKQHLSVKDNQFI